MKNLVTAGNVYSQVIFYLYDNPFIKLIPTYCSTLKFLKVLFFLSLISDLSYKEKILWVI